MWKAAGGRNLGLKEKRKENAFRRRQQQQAKSKANIRKHINRLAKKLYRMKRKWERGGGG